MRCVFLPDHCAPQLGFSMFSCWKDSLFIMVLGGGWDYFKTEFLSFHLSPPNMSDPARSFWTRWTSRKITHKKFGWIMLDCCVLTYKYIYICFVLTSFPISLFFMYVYIYMCVCVFERPSRHVFQLENSGIEIYEAQASSRLPQGLSCHSDGASGCSGRWGPMWRSEDVRPSLTRFSR